ncbi:unnamed protein product [Arabis nemorensis]|uniref:Uncharacterized protein n=1 Tax=Arabis nemorensis TaxID=586526 RepID=A0A565AP47_9BRAS|nr:unnamed protein product [Arabis nemorensis]
MVPMLGVFQDDVFVVNGLQFSNQQQRTTQVANFTDAQPQMTDLSAMFSNGQRSLNWKSMMFSWKGRKQ